KEKTFQDIMATIATLINDLLEIAGAWESAREKVSLMDWVQGEYVLVLGTSHTSKPLFKKLNAVVFERLSQLLLQYLPKDGCEDTLICLDELSQMGNLGSALTSLAREGRSRGVWLALATQDREGLEAEYGEKRAGEIVGLCASQA